MLLTLATLFDVYVFSSARLAFALRQTAELLEARNDETLAAIAAAVDRARVHTDELRMLEYGFRQTRARPRGRPEAVRISRQLGRALAAFRKTAQTYVDSAIAGRPDPKPAMARRLLVNGFPGGLSAMVHAPHVEQLWMVKQMLGEIASHHTDAIEALRLQHHLETIVRLNADFEEALTTDEGRTVEFAQVRAARLRAQQRLLEVVAHVVARFPSEDDDEARTEVLRPIFRQHEAIRDSLRLRRDSVEDLQPDVAEPVEEAAVDEAPDAGPRLVAVGED